MWCNIWKIFDAIFLFISLLPSVCCQHLLLNWLTSSYPSLVELICWYSLKERVHIFSPNNNYFYNKLNYVCHSNHEFLFERFWVKITSLFFYLLQHFFSDKLYSLLFAFFNFAILFKVYFDQKLQLNKINFTFGIYKKMKKDKKW